MRINDAILGAVLLAFALAIGLYARTLPTIPGQPPNLQHLPPGCNFQTRCPYRFERCVAEDPALLTVDPARGLARAKACHLDRPAVDHPSVDHPSVGYR